MAVAEAIEILASQGTTTITSIEVLPAGVRVRELDVTLETIDSVAGFHSNYSGKLLAPVPMRTLGRLSLGALLQTLGLALIVVEDKAALKQFNWRITVV